MFSKYVFKDKLISPKNGYQLKSLVNNKNSIKKFGFDTLEELEKEYPGFPHRCNDSQKKFDSTCNLRNVNRDKNIAECKKHLIKEHNQNKKLCKNCGIEIAFDKKNNIFCSRSCSAKTSNRTRGHRTEISKKKISVSLTGRTGRKGGRHKSCKITFKKCKVCDKSFYHRGHSLGRLTCSRKCQTEASTSNRTYQNGTRKPSWYFNKYQNKEVLLESSWEVQVAKLLDALNIIWIRPSPIEWQDSYHKLRLYYPDFYLPCINKYLDPKNPYCMKLDKEKLHVVSKSIDLIYGDLQQIIDFIQSIKKVED